MLDCVIIGGGVAGLAAGAFLEKENILLLEKEDKVGKKMEITGLGQCNLTHYGEATDFKDKYNKYPFIRTALNEFSNNDLIEYLLERGVETTLVGEKVFPKSLKAEKVVDCLKKNIPTRLKEKVKTIGWEEGYIVKTEKKVYLTRAVIVATGGISYPKTGSTGDGVLLANRMGIETLPYEYALCPIYVEKHPIGKLMGISFQGSISHFREKKIGEYKGDFLITHFGYSGPGIINNSRYMQKGDVLKINFIGMVRDQWSRIIKLEREENPKKSIKNILCKYAKTRLVEFFLAEAAIVDGPMGQLSKEDGQKILTFFTEYEVVIGQVGKENSGMISKGGIKTTELDKKTFMSKKHEGLYFIGECVDIDGETGGYNIQYAFSSAYLASKSVLEIMTKDKAIGI